MLAQTWNEDIEPKGYYLSEKLDGMRMIWTGSKMFSRNGNPIQFPEFFVKGWPKAYLDGELWLERDQFQKLVSITKRQVPVEDDWRKVKYMVFDAPGLKLPFKDRYLRFKQACEQANEFIVYVLYCQQQIVIISITSYFQTIMLPLFITLFIFQFILPYKIIYIIEKIYFQRLHIGLLQFNFQITKQE